MGTETIVEQRLKKHQYIMNNDTIVGIVITPQEFEGYKRYLYETSIIKETQEAKTNGPFFDSPKEAMSYLETL